MVLQTAIEGLNATIGKAIGRIENAIALSDQAQKASLALGQSLEGANRTLDGSIKGLRGSFGTRLQAGLISLNAGFQGNIKSIGKLINQQQLTNGNFRATAASLSKLEVVMGLSRSETSNLAEAMLDTNKTFGVSTDKLVASLDGLRESMPILSEAGLAGVPAALQALAGRVGPQMEKELQRVMGFIFDPSMDTQRKLAALGLGNLRERMAAGQNPLDVFLEAIPKASNVISNLGGDLTKFYSGFSVPLQQFGPVARDFIALNKSLFSRDQVERRNQADFFQQISVLKEEILAPLDMLFSNELYPKVLEFTDLLSRVAGPLVDKIEQKINEIFDDPLVSYNEFIVFLDDVQVQFTKLMNGLATGINFMTEGMIRFVESLDSSIFFDMEPQAMKDLRDRIKLNESLIAQREGRGAQFALPNITPEQAAYLGMEPLEDMKRQLAEDKEELANFFDRFIESTRLGQIDIVEDRFQQALLAQQADIAANTAATADHTDPDKLKSDIPFMLDASIMSLTDTLLAISRRSIEEPDPLQEGILGELRNQSDIMSTTGRSIRRK